jgi:hypothetical protein
MSTTTETTRVIGECDYNNRRYALLWKGQTKYGFRVKLAFRDLTKEFWTDEDQVHRMEIFPAPVDAADYAAGRPNRPDESERDNMPAEPIASYCASCGQQLPSPF